MSLIIHAIQNEEKRARGGKPGDQLQVVPSGEPDYKGEIRLASWYKRSDETPQYPSGWEEYLECTSDKFSDAAVEWAIKIADDRRFGYDQSQRWQGYKNIKKKGFADAAAGDFDCSSLAISIYILAGVPNLSAKGYTQNIDKYLLATGYFVKYTDEKHLINCDYAKRGGLYVRKGKHVIIMGENGSKYSGGDTPSPDPSPSPEPTEKSYVLILGNVNVRKEPNKDSSVIDIAHKSDSPLPYLGVTATDDRGCDWYYVTAPNGYPGYVSAFTNQKKKYTELVIIES